MTVDAEEWKRWTDARTAKVSAPHGVLSLTGTHWLAQEPVEIPGVPGHWSADGPLARVAAAAGDDLAVGGEAVDGAVGLRPDTDPDAQVARYRDVLLVPIEREGELAVRVFDPTAEARASFAGITVFPYAPEWSVPAVYTPFETGEQSITVPNADGHDRPLAVTGRIAFRLAGEPYALTVSSSGSGLSAVIADATSGQDTYRFRFVSMPAPNAEGRTVLDLNRAYLPPCAFADHFVCPFPPPGNRLPVAVRAGEKQVLRG
ncbi:hypothetical protein C7C46_05085 [Streptomyces tateyamensis]|uniref:DUF1684 domain-containing protein n=1 Tax=Streptomyces tateyamensis TaxID=565073 RepID=A0A2V4PME4_9ACTN|nr:DUF1684 domain-containing protein [Streptomyces tateyamensis]PYC87345.1 hypothetical protein C7C46_05085 [Streptomyces tateyamensis]